MVVKAGKFVVTATFDLSTDAHITRGEVFTIAMEPLKGDLVRIHVVGEHRSTLYKRSYLQQALNAGSYTEAK